MSRILVVERNVGLREALKQALEKKGHDVKEAVSAELALLTVSGYDGTFDIVALDVLTTGTDVVMDIRHDYPEIDIIAIAGNLQLSNVSLLEAAEGLGAKKTIGNPFVLKNFLAAVKELTPQGTTT